MVHTRVRHNRSAKNHSLRTNSTAPMVLAKFYFLSRSSLAISIPKHNNTKNINFPIHLSSLRATSYRYCHCYYLRSFHTSHLYLSDVSLNLNKLFDLLTPLVGLQGLLTYHEKTIFAYFASGRQSCFLKHLPFLLH